MFFLHWLKVLRARQQRTTVQETRFSHRDQIHGLDHTFGRVGVAHLAHGHGMNLIHMPIEMPPGCQFGANLCTGLSPFPIIHRQLIPLLASPPRPRCRQQNAKIYGPRERRNAGRLAEAGALDISREAVAG